MVAEIYRVLTYVPGTTLNTIHSLFYLTFKTIIKGKY